MALGSVPTLRDPPAYSEISQHIKGNVAGFIGLQCYAKDTLQGMPV